MRKEVEEAVTVAVAVGVGAVDILTSEGTKERRGKDGSIQTSLRV